MGNLTINSFGEWKCLLALRMRGIQESESRQLLWWWEGEVFVQECGEMGQ